MDLSNLNPPQGAKKRKKRVGRGSGSGHGKTSCRGNKGQKSRSGGKIAPWFEGGQMPLQRRIPKRGFRNIFKKEYTIINLKDLNIFSGDEVITIEKLRQQGLVKKIRDGVKVLGEGKLEKPLVIEAHKFSKSATEKIMAVGGTAKVI
ncbi:MAG: 50S ribosomal protein L15 [Nitrospinae bacterium RIFCSPLOWO2_12_FULL_45_22]|uniref:Large ribosomal subunit protein uL15 n=1 Tax=uncultured bacterium Rifle_16ft_4_minimus_4226 TaxID=1665160 RepID=A0A0H4TBC8_9BACT|nr:50S ribosomal protein L15, large subunit ribosomal protein L15 [uncultured bacterium Rifle_16ft_4_minimus_4226]OGW14992.1 MAG: 50S ribosomal protein L15 [Nitrospinae bacterium RIFCSPLOWO2_12_FULL_45_22]